LLRPEPCLVVAAQVPEQQSLEEPVLRASLLGRGIRAEARELLFHGLKLAPQRLLARRAERDHVLVALDGREPRLELEALRREPLEVDAGEALLHHGQPGAIGALADVEDVVEGAEALLPAIEV